MTAVKVFVLLLPLAAFIVSAVYYNITDRKNSRSKY